MVFAHEKTFLGDVLQSRLLMEFYHHLLSYMQMRVGLTLARAKLHVDSSPNEFNRAVRRLEAEVIILLIRRPNQHQGQEVFIRDAEVYAPSSCHQVLCMQMLGFSDTPLTPL